MDEAGGFILVILLGRFRRSSTHEGFTRSKLAKDVEIICGCPNLIEWRGLAETRQEDAIVPALLNPDDPSRKTMPFLRLQAF
jgi:hypothetical protein